jgi:hypothetical protein
LKDDIFFWLVLKLEISYKWSNNNNILKDLILVSFRGVFEDFYNFFHGEILFEFP